MVSVLKWPSGSCWPHYRSDGNDGTHKTGSVPKRVVAVHNKKFSRKGFFSFFPSLRLGSWFSFYKSRTSDKTQHTLSQKLSSPKPLKFEEMTPENQVGNFLEILDNKKLSEDQSLKELFTKRLFTLEKRNQGGIFIALCKKCASQAKTEPLIRLLVKHLSSESSQQGESLSSPEGSVSVGTFLENCAEQLGAECPAFAKEFLKALLDAKLKKFGLDAKNRISSELLRGLSKNKSLECASFMKAFIREKKNHDLSTGKEVSDRKNAARLCGELICSTFKTAQIPFEVFRDLFFENGVLKSILSADLQLLTSLSAGMVCHADDKFKEALFSKVFHGFVTGALRIDPKVNPESAREEAIATIFQALGASKFVKATEALTVIKKAIKYCAMNEVVSLKEKKERLKELQILNSVLSKFLRN